MTPMKFMAGMAKDEKIISTIDAAEVFVLTIADVMAVFTGEYDGGEFCSGLIFGKDGSKMMLQIAQAFVKAPPKEHDPEMKEVKVCAASEGSACIISRICFAMWALIPRSTRATFA